MKGIFLDLDDTLVNHSQAQDQAIEKMHRYFPKEDKERFNELWRWRTVEYWQKFERKELTFEEQRLLRIQAIWEHFGPPIPARQVIERANEYVRHYEEALKPNPAILALIDELGLPIGIITNGDSDQQRGKLALTGLKVKPELILISTEIGYSKPDTKIFELAEQRMRIKPGKLLMIGDNFKKDIEPAQQRGWMTLQTGIFRI